MDVMLTLADQQVRGMDTPAAVAAAGSRDSDPCLRCQQTDEERHMSDRLTTGEVRTQPTSGADAMRSGSCRKVGLAKHPHLFSGVCGCYSFLTFPPLFLSYPKDRSIFLLL